jgi:orotidine-5'-phosphate decarboxylase
MLLAARQGIQESNNINKPLIMAVTVLTSFDTAALNNINITASLEQQVLKLADLTVAANLDGVVCSGLEVKLIKNKYNNKLKILTPGIRLASTKSHDQKRIMTPKEALMTGSDYLVIGRAITESGQPKIIIENIINSLSSDK